MDSIGLGHLSDIDSYCSATLESNVYHDICKGSWHSRSTTVIDCINFPVCNSPDHDDSCEPFSNNPARLVNPMTVPTVVGQTQSTLTTTTGDPPVLTTSGDPPVTTLIISNPKNTISQPVVTIHSLAPGSPGTPLIVGSLPGVLSPSTLTILNVNNTLKNNTEKTSNNTSQSL
ncbi:hypothetical protein WDU94_007193 [Cyamophila willieti]